MAISDIVTTVLISGTAAAVLTRLVDWLRHRGSDKADTAGELTENAMKLVASIREDARQQFELYRLEIAAMRMDVAEARNEAAAARNEATQARREAMFAVATLRNRDLAILSPYATLESLRDLVQAGPNGFGGASIHQPG